MCIQKRKDYMHKIYELRLLPPTAELATFTKKSIPSQMKNLEEINKKMQQYSHVNQKAFDQYVNLSEQRTQLIKQREKIDKGGIKVMS
jgi:chromosome segregation ATPase